MRRPLAFLFLLLAAVTQSEAAEPVIEMAPAPANVTEHSISTGVAGLQAEIRLRNISTDPQAGTRFYSTSGLLIRKSDGTAVPARWKRITPPPAGLSPTGLAPGQIAVLEISASLPEVGLYETFIDTYGVDATTRAEFPDRRLRIVVTRESDTLPSELIVEPKPAGRIWPWSGGAERTLVTLRNTTPRAVDFKPPAIVSFNESFGDSQTTVATAAPPQLDARGCASPLGPGESCAIGLEIGQRLSPGEYLIDVGVAGVGGGWSQQTQTIRVRASWIISFAVIVLGTGLGWYVQHWRSRGRRAITTLIDIARQRERIARLRTEPVDQALAQVFANATEQAEDLERKCQNGIDVTADVERLGAHVTRISGAAAMLRTVKALPEKARHLVQPRLDGYLARLTDYAEPGAVEAQGKALLGDLNALPKLSANIAVAADLCAAVDGLRASVGDHVDAAAVEAASTRLRSLIGTAMAPLPAEPDDDTVPARCAALDKEIDNVRTLAASFAETARQKLIELATSQAAAAHGDAALRQRAEKVAAQAKGLVPLPQGSDPKARLQELAPLWREHSAIAVALATANSRGRESIAPPDAAEAVPAIDVARLPTIDVPFLLFPPASGAGPQRLQEIRWRHEIFTNLIILVAVGIAGVLSLWAPDPTWGSVADFGAAFLAGLAARVVIGEAGMSGQPTGGN